MIPPGNIKSSFVVASLRAGVAVSSFESVLKMILNGRTVAENLNYTIINLKERGDLKI